MAALTPLLVVVHALAGVALLGGLFGRWIVLGLAARADSLADMRTLTRAAAPFERIVILASQVVLVLGIVTALTQGRPILGPLQGAPLDWLFVSLLLFVSVLPLIPIVFLPRGRVFEAALAEATTHGAVTPALRAAFHDPVVRTAHVYELVAVSLVFALMVSRPF